MSSPTRAAPWLTALLATTRIGHDAQHICVRSGGPSAFLSDGDRLPLTDRYWV